MDTAPHPRPERPQPLPRVMATDHHGKSRAIMAGLEAAGCERVDHPALADLLLIDHDWHLCGRLPLVEACVQAGGKAMLYPHGAAQNLMSGWDGMYPVSPLLSGALVTSWGHAEVARRFGYHHPVFDVGWSMCELRPHRTVTEPANVLFAPMHPPWESGWNAPVFERLIRTPFNLTVRYLDTLEENALWEVPGVTYHRGEVDDFAGMLAQIDAADVVVAPTGTFMCLAVARGVPVVTWRSDWTNNNTLTAHSANRDRYRDFIRHPFDADHGDLEDLIRAAARDTVRREEWADRFIGAPLDAERVLDAYARAPRRRLVDGQFHIAPETLWSMHRTALSHAQRGELEQAQALLARGLADGTVTEVLNDLAVLWSAGDRPQDAMLLLRAVLAIDPGNAEAAGNLGTLGAAMGLEAAVG